MRSDGCERVLLPNMWIIRIVQNRGPKQFPLLPPPPPPYRTEHPEMEEIGSQDAEFFMRQERLDKILPHIGGRAPPRMGGGAQTIGKKNR